MTCEGEIRIGDTVLKAFEDNGRPLYKIYVAGKHVITTGFVLTWPIKGLPTMTLDHVPTHTTAENR